MMGWLREALDLGVRRGVEKAVADYCAPGGGLDAIVEQCVWEHMAKTLSPNAPLTRLGFTWALRLCFRERGCSYADASDLANDTLREFLADEKIRFGDTAYAWTRSGAAEVAEEYQFRHWERAA